MSVFDDIKNMSGVGWSFVGGEDISTYKGGGKCRVFEPKSMAELGAVVGASYALFQVPFLLGGGSNVIVADGVVDRVVVSTRHLNKIKLVRVDDKKKLGYVYAECGARVQDVTKIAREFGLGGFEFLWGVPCTVGGVTKMNAGAFSTKMSDYIHKIDILSVDFANWYAFNNRSVNLNATRIDKNEIAWGYRQGVCEIVVGVLFALPFVEKEVSLGLARECLQARRTKHPMLPSVGSVFKNGDVPSGRLIEACGLKGMKIGGAQISAVHANFIVNVGGGSASDFLKLVKLCEREVYCAFGVKLQREFCLLD